MEITEVRIKLTEEADDRLAGFCSITFDNCFVVRDLKIIEGPSGPFVAMPSRKLTFHCPRCNAKNHLRAAYCNQCGRQFRSKESPAEGEGRVKLYADIAHPINSACREMIQQRVIEAYLEERERARSPGYVSRYDDAYLEPETGEIDEYVEEAQQGSDPTTRVEPGESAPRGPHRARPAEPESEPEPPGRRQQKFGEGIFETD